MKKQPEQVIKSYPLILVTGLLILAVIGIYKADIYQNSAVPQTQKDGNTENWKRVIDPNALFFSKIFLDRTSTYVLIPIKFDDTTKISWLSLDSTSSAEPSEFLMTHPQLENLNWPKLSQGTIHLYQRKPTYSSIEAFVTKPPPPNKTAIDNAIKGLDQYKNVPGFPLDDSFKLDNVDYILTTYNSPVKEKGAFYYENIIDASKGVVNSNDSLSWRINVPSASSESAYYLGQIHIDYNRQQ